MMMISSRLRVVAARRPLTMSRAMISSVVRTTSSRSSSTVFLISMATASAVAIAHTNKEENKTYLSAARLPTSGDVISVGTPVKEASTGILFPQLCNGYYLAGTGVRIKYGFVKVYAVGTYMDPLAVAAVKHSRAAIEQCLLDPTYPRTIRLVMNRNLSVEKFTSAIVEALEPRMMGQDLDKLEEFKKLNPPVDLIQGAEIEMTIRGDTLLYKNAAGGVGSIRSEVFTRAMCDTYYGADPVSPGHKQACIEGVAKL
jgi:hypothetical protein